MKHPKPIVRLGRGAAFVVASLAIFLPAFSLKPLVGGLGATAAQLVLTLVLWLLVRRAGGSADEGRSSFWRDLVRSLFAVSAALAAVSLINLDYLGVNVDSATALATAKLVDAVVIVGVALFVLAWQGVSFGEVFLQRGRLLMGTLIGIGACGAMIFLGMGRPGNDEMLQVLRTYWFQVGVFVSANAIMEELIFRGVFLRWLRDTLGRGLAVVTTSLVFAIAHLNVQYQSPDQLVGFLVVVFVLGCLWATLTLFTRSILASVLFHAGADVAMMTEIFKSYGI